MLKMKQSTIELTHSHRCEIESPFLFEFLMVKRGGKRAPNLNDIITKIMSNNNLEYSHCNLELTLLITTVIFFVTDTQKLENNC